MSITSEKFQTLKQWDTYKSNEDFKKYALQNSLSENEQRALIAAYGEIGKFNSNEETLSDASIIDKALEIKQKYEAPKKPTSNQNHLNTKKTIQENANKEYEKLEFRGDTIEYFKIWIVNIFLTIVTLGIYSAWAKVRTNRYFYANTYYQNVSFEYTANPVSILKGRLIIFAIYAIFIFSSQVLLNPIVTFAILGLVLAIVPWLINRAVKFKLKYIKHRNINFRYDENAPSFYKFFLLHTILIIITVGLAYPYSLNKFKDLLLNNSKFGSSEFEYEGETGGMYKQFLKTIGMYFGLILIPIAVLGAVLSLILPSFTQVGIEPALRIFMIVAATIVSYVLFVIIGFAVKGFYDAYIANFVWSKTTLADNCFKSTLKPIKLAWIYVSNIFAIIFSLGLLTPWAKVRVTKYKCENFAIASTNMSGFIATEQENQSAIGEESGDFFDIDIGV